MRQPLWKALVSVCFLAFILIAVPQPAAQAGFFDRIKDIYNTPEKISELEQQYIEAKEALVDQRQLLEDSARKQQELIEQNEQFRQQNEQLIAKNASMQAEMERMKQDRQSFLSKLMNTVIILAALFVAYIVSIRVWRYMIWRKQRSANGRGMGG